MSRTLTTRGGRRAGGVGGVLTFKLIKRSQAGVLDDGLEKSRSAGQHGAVAVTSSVDLEDAAAAHDRPQSREIRGSIA